MIEKPKTPPMESVSSALEWVGFLKDENARLAAENKRLRYRVMETEAGLHMAMSYIQSERYDDALAVCRAAWRGGEDG